MTKNVRHTSTDYRHPVRPLPVRLLNMLLRRADLSMEGLLRAARNVEKFDHFGDPAFQTPFALLLDSIEREAALTPFGRFATRARLINILRNRLRLERLFLETPELNDIPIPPVVLITGMQRTGTTLLHRILAADPNTRSLASWEAVNPAPFPLPPAKDRAKRLRVARQSQRALAMLAPDFFAVHPVEAESPEEDVLLLDYAFVSTVPESILNVPSYSEWVEAADQRPAYRYMKRLIQLLQYQNPKKRWILKSPHHLEFLDTFFETFPGARVIQTHRDPVFTLPSFCSMISHCHGIFSDHVDPMQIGNHWLRKTAGMQQRGRAFLTQLPNDQYMDIDYDRLIADPMVEVECIYEMLGVELNAETRSAMETVRHASPRHQYGIHVYRMEDFGLTREKINGAYASPSCAPDNKDSHQ
jgi:hypothetical protein